MVSLKKHSMPLFSATLQFSLLFLEFVLCLLRIGMVTLIGEVTQEVKKVFLTDFLSFRKRIIGSIVDGFR